MGKQATLTKQADAKGRITLGESFANRTVLVEERDDEVVIRLARVIPEKEAWLYDNAKALSSVRKGLAQARSGKFVKGPDLNEASALADKLQDD